MKDIIDIAAKEIGYKESSTNNTKYGKWFGMNGQPWCHMFVCWCVNQSDYANSSVPKTASCSTGRAWFQNKGLFKNRGAYTPKRNDIIYFGSHVGIVEKVVGNTVHTIEGNTSDKVAKRQYLLSSSAIVGYGLPNTSKNSAKKKTKNKSSELAYLKKILNNKSSSTEKVSGEVQEIKNLAEVDVQLIIQNGNKRFCVPVLDDMSLSFERVGSPGVLSFQTPYQKGFDIQEGNSVLLSIDGKKVFYGFVFTKQKDKSNIWTITVYNQLRYLKNKDTYIYQNKTASDVIRMIARDYHLKTGTLAKIKHAMSKIEEDSTLFDIIQNILDDTLLNTGNLYVMYDDVGKMTLKNVSTMKVNSCLIDEETGEDYKYQSSIDQNTYNQIKLVYESKDSKKKSKVLNVYICKSTEKINQWGLLQYFEKIDSPKLGKIKANALLKLYNKKSRNLTIDNAFGNTAVIAGSLIPVILDLDGFKVQNYMLVEKVTHKFKNKEHKMDLILTGGGFSA